MRNTTGEWGKHGRKADTKASVGWDDVTELRRPDFVLTPGLDIEPDPFELIVPCGKHMARFLVPME